MQAQPLAPPAPAQAPSKTVRYDVRDGFSLAFVDADVRRVADAVLGTMLGLDYSVDPAISGTVTLRTARPVTRESLLPLLETALASVDAAIIVSGSSYRVVPRSAARARASMAGSSGTQQGVAGFANEVVPLGNASAREIGRLLTEFMGREILAGTDPARNQVVISGSSDERAAARALITRFDIDAMAGMTFQLIRLENVDPDTLFSELEQIFQPPYDIIGTRVRVVPLARMKSVLVIAASTADIAKVEPWIRRLDLGGSGKPRLYSYAVQNGRARDIAASLQLVLGGGSSVAEPVAGATTPQAQSAPLSIIDNLSQTSASDSSEPSRAIGAQTPLPGTAPPLPSVVASGTGPRIVPDEANNALLIYANGEQYELITDALEKLDRPVPQILIEATLAEVTLTKDFSLGVDWSFISGNSTFDLRNAATAAPTRLFPGFAYSYIGSSAQVVLNALQSKTNVRILSAPRLMVLNNQTATLQVGDQVPIVTQQSQSVSAPGAPIVNNVDLRDTGVILKVTPRVNNSGTVTLDIAQEVSDVATTTTSGINSPTIQQRRLASTVSTRSGQMIALGGLIRDRTTRTRSGIPLLSQIPIIGAAFGTQVDRGAKTELIILLTPTVLRSADEAKAAVEELIDNFDQVRPIVDHARSRQLGAPKLPR